MTIPYCPSGAAPRVEGRRRLSAVSLAPVGEREELVNRFGAGVRPAALRRRAHHEVAVLAERHVVREARDLRVEATRTFFFFLLACLSTPPCRARSSRWCAPALDDELDADRRREVKNHVALVDQLGHERLVVDAVDGVVKTRVAFEVRDVVDAPRREVVDDEDLVAALKVCVREVRPDKPRTACNQYSQISVPFQARLGALHVVNSVRGVRRPGALADAPRRALSSILQGSRCQLFIQSAHVREQPVD